MMVKNRVYIDSRTSYMLYLNFLLLGSLGRAIGKDYVHLNAR